MRNLRQIVLLLAAMLAACASAHAQASYRSSSSITYATRTNTTLTAPAGIVDGDMLLIFFDIASASAPPTPTPPAGFTNISGTSYQIAMTTGSFNVNLWVWYKVASSESGNYTITHSSSTTQGYMEVVQGVSGDAPTRTVNQGTGATATALTITTSVDDSLVIFFTSDWGDNANNLACPTGTTPTFTEHYDAVLMHACDGPLATAGATGNKTASVHQAAALPWGAMLVQVPASGGGAAPTPMLTLMGVGD